jgi:tRNA splicing endonuclease
VYNALKHFDDNEAKGKVPVDVLTPMWLVDDGIECVGSEGEAKLHFKELIDVQRDLEKDARWISEEVYRFTQERGAKTNGGTV